MTRRALATAILAALAAAVPAAAQTTPERIVDLAKTTTVREYDGWLLYSRWDGSAYHLATFHDGTQQDLAVPTQSQPFDADAGPDSNGSPSAVVSICKDTCDLFVIGFTPGDQLRPVNNANTTDHDEIAPSVWKGRLVFGRRYGKDEVLPYTKLMKAPRSHPSDRLAGLPDTRCGSVDPPSCRPIKDVDLPAMELSGQRIAQSWTYQPDSFPGFRQNEIRLTNVDRTDTRQIAYMTTGLGGQTYLGPSVVDGRVAFDKVCQGDPDGCDPRTSGDIRYRISDATYQLVGETEQWTGWAYDGTSDFHVPSDFDCSGGEPGAPPTEPCGIYRRSGLPWKDTAGSHFH